MSGYLKGTSLEVEDEDGCLKVGLFSRNSSGKKTPLSLRMLWVPCIYRVFDCGNGS